MTYRSLDKIFQQALALKKERRYHEALPLYEELLREGFRSAFFFSSAAHLFFLVKEYERALPLVESSLAIRGDEPFTSSLKGKILLQLGNRDEAFRVFADCASLDQGAGTARDVVGFLTRSGEVQEALDYLERLLARLPAQKELLTLRADLLRSSGRKAPEGADAAGGGRDDESRARQVEMQLSGLSPADALEEMKTLLAIPSRRQNTALLRLYGRMLYNARQYREAYQVYREMWERSPGDRFVRSQMAFSLVHEGKSEEALPILEEILTREPDNMYVKNALLKAYKTTGSAARGAEFFQGMVARYPAMKSFWGLVRKLSSTSGGHGGQGSGEIGEMNRAGEQTTLENDRPPWESPPESPEKAPAQPEYDRPPWESPPATPGNDISTLEIETASLPKGPTHRGRRRKGGGT